MNGSIISTGQDALRYERNPLDVIFAPRSVAVVGASERQGSVARAVLWNLISSSFGGIVFPINPKQRSILGIKAYPSVSVVPDQVDLAVIVTPAPTVPSIIRECVGAGVKGAIILSAGFKETGPEGAALEQQILDEARPGRMRIIGPNCLGVMNPIRGFNATFASATARAGSVGFISQSGALCASVLDWSLRENVGFSAFVSIGSMLDVGWGDLIYYLGDDSRTKSIVMYMETIGDARAFLSAAREVALTKPIIVIKPGRTAAAAQAAASHTGSLTGSDEVLAAAFRRCGVLRVDTIDDLFNMAEVLAKQPRPRGPRLTIVTNAGGPGVLATDALIAGGGQLAVLSEESVAALNGCLPPHWSHGNPVDILGDADAERYARAIEVTLRDANSDGLLVILTPQAMTDPTQTAQAVRQLYAGATGHAHLKPMLASWMGGSAVAAGEAMMNQVNISTFPFPDTAARVFNYMWRYNKRLQSLYETPRLPTASAEDLARHERAAEMIDRVRGSGRTLLTELESKQLLTAYGIPSVPTHLADSADQAVDIAQRIGYPVALKLNSEIITHKSDVGGVRLGLTDADEVRHAYGTMARTVSDAFGAQCFGGATVQPMLDLNEGYELIIGSSPDAQFGPVLLFGAGGILVEVFRDRALGLPPLNTTLAQRMMEQTTIYEALRGIRGREPVDLRALEELMVRFSGLVVEQRWIKEIDINPLLASASGLVALDARVLLYGPEVTEEMLPRLAIRPYPARYVGPFIAHNGERCIIRPIRAEDEPKIVKFHETLSETSLYLRYLSASKLSHLLEHERLTRICFVDYDRTMALVVERTDEGTGEDQIVAIGSLNKVPGSNEGEFDLLVGDPFQGRGFGVELLSRLLNVGRDEGLERVLAYILSDNWRMRRICEKLGFALEHDGDAVKAVKELRPM